MGVSDNIKVYGYAQQFVDSIKNREDIWAIYDEIESCISIIDQTGLNRILLDSTVSDRDKEKFIRNLRQSTYRVINDLIESIIQQADFTEVREIFQTVLRLISKQKNQFDLHISSYQELTDDQKNRIQTIVERQFEVKTRNMIVEIDKTLIGGFIVTVNHQVIDASVRKQLSDIRKKL